MFSWWTMEGILRKCIMNEYSVSLKKTLFNSFLLLSSCFFVFGCNVVIKWEDERGQILYFCFHCFT